MSTGILDCLRGPTGLILTLTLGWTIFLTGSPSWAQVSNPYGQVDSADASITALRRSVGGAGDPEFLETFANLDPPGLQPLLDGILVHEVALMRVAAARRLIETGSDPGEILGALEDPLDRNAVVVSLFAKGMLTPDLARGIQKASPDLGITPLVLLHATIGNGTKLESVATSTDAPLLARGIATAAGEGDAPGGFSDWLDQTRRTSELSEAQFDRLTFEILAAAEQLQLTEAVRVLTARCGDRPADDALRAAAVLALLELDPEDGQRHWQRLFDEAPRSRRIPIGLLLVTAGVAAPATFEPVDTTKDALPTAIWRLVRTEPEARGEAAADAVARGHGPTTQWLLTLSKDDAPVESLLAVLDRVLRDRRASLVPFGIAAAARVAEAQPAEVASRIRRCVADGDSIGASIGLRGLVAAGTPEASEVAIEFMDAPARNVRSLALLAVARGGTLDDEARIRQLGRAAAGGGELPEDLRPLAAWYYLRSQNRLPADIPRILDS